MAPKYDREEVHMTREEEGSYHRQEIEPARPSENYTQSYTQVVRKADGSRLSGRSGSNDRAVTKYGGGGYSSGDDHNDNFEEWTTSKRKVNHKTRQIETRVSRQLLVEDGKVIADSGPQVTTRIKEDNKEEECEREKQPRNKSRFDALEGAPECAEGEASGRVLGEKKEIQRVTREVREENMQYHDERFKELSGPDVHRKALKAPHELITINERAHDAKSAPRGKMVHYSNKGHVYKDTDEVLEVAKLAIDGSITKEVKRTRHHEEYSDDERPDEHGEAEALKAEPIEQKSSRKHFDYVKDFDDTSTPSGSDVEETHHSSGRRQEAPHRSQQHHSNKQYSSRYSSARDNDNDDNSAAFPRYDRDPLMNSLHDEDFKPVQAAGSTTHRSSPASRARQLPLERKDSSASDSSSGTQRRRYHQSSAAKHTASSYAHSNRSVSPLGGRVEIPEEYRIKNRSGSKSKQSAGTANLSRSTSRAASTRERSLSPAAAVAAHRAAVAAAQQQQSQHKKQHSSRARKEDASVQAHLTTDEEEERASIRQRAPSTEHKETARALQRQSTRNSQRNYYYGDAKRRSSLTSSSASSSSASDNAARRKHGSRSRDSGVVRSPTPQQQEIYAVSSKSRGRSSIASPAPSVGQRSVKTATTTFAAGLTDRPRSRQSAAMSPDERELLSPAPSSRPKSAQSQASSTKHKRPESASKHNRLLNRPTKHDAELLEFATWNAAQQRSGAARRHRQRQQQPLAHTQADDTVSLSSLGPSATKIQVPYIGSSSRQQTDSVADNVSLIYTDTESCISIAQQDARDRSPMLAQDIEQLRERIKNINRNTVHIERPSDAAAKSHFDYATLVADVAKNKQQVVQAYNAHAAQQASPFYNAPTTTSELGSSECGHSSEISSHAKVKRSPNNNNNYYDGHDSYTSNYHKALPCVANADDDDNMDCVSLASSMRSSRTYHVRSAGNDGRAIVDVIDVAAAQLPQEAAQQPKSQEQDMRAWIFDLRDNSATRIPTPPKPAKPEPPKLDEHELGQSSGGRAYYLEVRDDAHKQRREEAHSDSDNDQERVDRPSSVCAHRSKPLAGGESRADVRWSSQLVLSSSDEQPAAVAAASLGQTNRGRTRTKPSSARSTAQLATSRTASAAPGLRAASKLAQTNKSSTTLSASTRHNSEARLPTRSVSTRNLGAPSTGMTPAKSEIHLPFAQRSRSSSCLVASTRPTKYSIYGGINKPSATNKPVPRLSYSRAIGPKSFRRPETQTKTAPSRYLKTK